MATGEPLNLNQFYQKLQNPGVKLTYQFRLNFFGTSIASILPKYLEDSTEWIATGSELPKSGQETAPIAFNAYTFSVPTVMNFGTDRTFTLTFNCDSTLSKHNAMMAWMAIASDPDIEGGSTGGGEKTLPDTFIQVDLYDHKMANIKDSYVLVGAYPSKVSPMNVSNENPTVGTFQVTFRYQYWFTKQFSV